MFAKRLFLTTFTVVAVVHNVLAQTIPTAQTTQTQSTTQTSSPVTATITSDGAVRLVSPGETIQTRLELYSSAGERVYDSGSRQGNVIDWKQTDAAVVDGAYLAVVSTKGFDGKWQRKYVGLSLQAGQATLSKQRRNNLNSAQLQAIDANQSVVMIDDDSAVVVLREGKERAAVVSTHDGQNGQVTATTGDLTLNTGDIFSNQSKEQMRVTNDGRVGIGTDKPEATLDVAGTVRARWYSV
jgi:hypothetical protein